MTTRPYPYDPQGDLVPILEASIEAAKLRHPSSKEPMTVTLTGADRCDRCNATAGYRVGKFGHPEGVDLPDDAPVFNQQIDFCVHHWRKHYPSMADKGWTIVGSNPDVIRPQEESHG